MFDPVDPKQSFPDLERGILRYWKEEDIFQRSVHERPREETFTFYDGPPFATGLPHYGHLLAGTIKDVIPRYQTMKGKRVERRFGWDCHGLPVENIIEKEHNLKDKKQIEAMGVAAFNGLCRGAVQRYTKEWRVSVERVGRWVDMDHDYRTMDPAFMESIWWVFKTIHEKGLIYEGHKPMHVCPRCTTPLSNFEVTQGYKDVTDATATAMFELADEPGTHVLAWTTTPWTLPGNLFLAVNADVTYAKVRSEGKTFIVAKDRVEAVFKDKEHEVSDEMAGSALVGRRFRPLFPYYAAKYPAAFEIVVGDFVTTDDGTGIVHIAPGFGEDDFKVGKEKGVPLLQHVSMDGRFKDEVTDFAGMEVKPADDPSKTDRKVIDHLKAKGLLFATESYRHSYPHCWRCDSPLLNYATGSWFVRVEQVKADLLKANAETEWVPAHLRDGRFGRWLEGARDWAISRNRYWGTPLPIWRAGDEGALDVLGGRADLMSRKKLRFTKLTAVRHGESKGNLIPVYQGELPGTDLTERGRGQAAAAGEALAREKVDVIYCSPLARTRQTAEEIAAKTGARVIVDERLREIRFGEYEGKTIDFSDLAMVKAKRALLIEKGSPETIYHFEGMETWDSSLTRVTSFLDEILPRHRSEHVVVVSHADPIRAVRHYFTKEDPLKLSRQPFIDYASPESHYWDHAAGASMDLHKEFVDGVCWPQRGGVRKTEIALVRHGQTDWNAAKRVQGGDADIDINEEGERQARELAATLKAGDYDVVISSTRTRAIHTATILADAMGMTVAAQWPELDERDYGTWVGKPVAEMREACGILPEVNPPMMHATPDGGESLNAFLGRAEAAYRRLLEEYAGRRVLVVCHGGTIRAIRAVADNLSYPEAAAGEMLNCSLTPLTVWPMAERIPEVLDCWFESGSMPYAQIQYPYAYRSADAELPPGFPADFIAEGIDQTRGWFYTLTVLSGALFKKPAFKHCVVNGTVLAEDGRKMSKRLKNYPDPLEVVEKYGADALRFSLMSSSAVRGEDLKFSAKLVEETVRAVVLPLWNAYSFFITYANAAGFSPVSAASISSHPLDRALRAQVQDLANRMTQQLDAYDLSATCGELHDTIDFLTNWYIRLSRRRFAGKGAADAAEARVTDHEQDRADALATLHETLITLCRLLAPFCPFVTEAIYLNLAPQAHGSVHLTRWPDARALSAEETQLLRKTLTTRMIASLGLKLRSEKKIKVRQPLQRLTVAMPAEMRGSLALSDEDVSILRQELNVKEIAFADDPGTLGDAVAMVDARKAGPRLGKRVQELIAAGKRGEFTVRADGSVAILDETLSADEVRIEYRGKEGQEVAAERGIVVGLDTRITDELKAEGDVRELVRAVQQLRKDAGLTISDRITLQIDGADALVAAYGELIAQETGSVLGTADGEPASVELDCGTVAVRFSA